jgi:hypothetical protein
MPRSQRLRKAKRTFSLSPEAMSYLESVRKEERRASMSSVLERIIRERQQAKEMERISSSVTQYYDSLTDEDRAENRAWGKLAESQFPSEE